MFEKIFQKYDRIVFFDTETTGLDPDKGDQIIELAALAVDKNGGMEEMDSFLKLQTLHALPEKISKLTGITDSILATDGIPEEEAFARFMGLVESETIRADRPTILLVAHNAQFDLRFLAYGLLRHKAKHPEWMAIFRFADFLDTLTIYRDRHEFPHRLENAIEYYELGTKVQNTHRAVDDCRGLFEVAKAMEEERDDLNQYINIFGYSEKYGISGKKLAKVTYLAQPFANYSGKTLPEQLGRRSNE